MKLKEFLKETKRALSYGFQDKVEVHVVIGNESCDLDSAVCSVVLAYLLTLTSGTKDVVVIPVLDIPQQKYHLRTETTFLLRKYEISEELLTFSDQIDLDDLHRQGKLKLSLVDHNILPEKYIGLDDCVVSVTDHRPQVRKQDNRVKINIAKVGSCATLVAEEFFSRTDLTFDKTALTFLYGAILIDTVNLSPAAHKMTDQDVAMTDKLKEMLPEINGDDLYNSIHKAKTDISELTTLELLEKDLKIVSGTSIKVAMSSVSISLQDFLSRENLIEDLSSFVQSQSVLAVIVMMIHQVTEGQPVRDIAVYSTEIILQQKICDQLSANRDPVLELSPVPTDKQNLTCYKQGCVRASRKVVLPLIQSIVNEYKDVTSHSDEHSNSAEKPLDSIDLFNLSGDQTSQNQFVASVPLDNFDLLNLAGQQSSQNQPETGTNQNLMDEFDIFAGTDTVNNAQINNTDVFNDLPLDSQNQLDLNFDLVGTSEQTSQLESSSNVDLLGGFDPFSSSSYNTPIIVNNLPSNIPEINIDSEQATDEFNEADIMFGSQTLETPHSGMNSVSQGSSAHNSEPGSAFASYPITPPNSFIDATGHAHAKEFVLPSLNSAEMLEKIREKKGRLQSTESTSADGTDNDPNSVPYTPQNSYMEGAFDQYAKDHQLPSFNSMEMVQRIKQKRSSMEMSRLDEEDDIVRLRSESGEVTPFTPHNSFRDLSLLEKNSNTFLDTNRLHQTLRNIEDDASEANQDVDEDSLTVNEITDSGLLMFDTSDMLNPTDIHNNVVAVGIAQEMVKRETTSEDLLVSFFDAPSDGGSRLTDSSSSSFDTKSSQDRGENSNNDNNFQNFQSKGSNSDDLKTEELVLDQSIDEFAQNLTENLIEDAINSFPENELPTETEKEELSATSPVSTEENYFKENKILEILESPSSTGSVITPEEVPVETDYLSSVDPMHGNLDLVKAAEEKEIVESISFRKISGEEPQTVRQEILLRNTPDKVDEDTEPKMEDSNGAVDEYAAELIQQVISGAIATVTTATNTVNRDIVSDSSSDITEESGVTWSRETSFDTVSSIPSKDGQTVIWSNQGSLDTPRSSIDTGATSLESDEMLLLAQSAKNGQMSSFETPESNDYLSSTSSSKRSSDPTVESSEKIKEHSVSDLNKDVSNEKELVQSSFNDQSDSLLEFAAGSDFDKHDGNQINNQTLLDFAGSDLIQTDLLAESLKSDDAINELSNISDKPAVGMVNIDKMESVDYISSENEAENLSPLRSDNALNELSNILDKPAVGMGTIDKMESVELSSENEAENLSSLKTNNAFNELSNISDKPAVGMVNISEMESVDYIPSENEAENLSPLKSGDAFNEQRNISDEPAIGEGNIDKMESVDYISSENEAENLSPLKSADAVIELSNISDKPAFGMVNIDKMDSVDYISSENEAENLSPLKSEDALNELSNISDEPAIGMGNINKMESVDYISSENEAENLSPLKSDEAFNELSNISDKPTVGMWNIDKMEAVDYISSENEAENMTTLNSEDTINELSNISDKPAVGMVIIDKMESVDYISSENKTENLRSDNASNELSNISDKPAIGMVNIDKMESVELSSENEAENLSSLKSDNAFNELNDISDIPAIGMENIDKMESVDFISSENEAENLSPLKTDDAFNELSNSSDKPAIGIVNTDKMESVDYISSENEAENSSPLKSADAVIELSNISDKPAIGMVNIDKMESVELSSENEAESLSTLKSDNVGLLEQSQDSVPYNIRKKESLDYISSEGETDNLVKLQHESEDLKQNARSTYHKAETLNYISSEGEGNDTEFVTTLQGMYSSQSSEPTSTTTEGSYQVLSPDQQIQDIKGEITDMINSEIEGEVTHIISDIKMEFSGLNPDVCETKENENTEFVNEEKEIDENETDLNKHDKEFISNENLLGGVAELGDLKGDNLKFSNNSSNELVGEGNEIDENETDLKKNDEKLINNENLLSAVTEGYNEIHDELKGDNFECSNNSTNELAGEGNEIDEKETNLNKQDEEFITNENLEGAEAEGYNEIHDESKGNNLEFSNISTNELTGEGNEIDENETDLKKQDEEVISNENLLGLVAEGYNEINGELKGDNVEFTNNSSNELVGGGKENDENETNLKKDDEVINNENLLGSVAEGELKGDNLNFSNISSNELVGGGNEIDFNKHDEEVISNENLLGGVTEHGELKGDHLEFSINSSNELVEEGNEIETDLNKQDEEFVSNENFQGAVAEGELKGDNLEFSNISANELVGERNEIDENETDLKKQDEEVICKENLLGSVAEGYYEEKDELKGDNLEFSNVSSEELVGEGNEINEKETNENETDLNKHDEELISNENLLGVVAEGYNEIHGELKGDNLEFSNNSSNELVEEGNEINENEIDFNKHDQEVISNKNLLGVVTEHGELKGDHLEFSNNSSNELVEEGNEIDETDLNKQDEEFVSNENFQGAVAEGELKGDNLEFSNISTNELVGERNEIDENETDLKKQDEEVICKENLLGSVAEGYYEEKDELKGDNLEFTNNSSNEFAGKGNENEKNEIDLNKHDGEVVIKENLQGAVAEGYNEIHGESKGDNLEFTNTSSNELAGEENEMDETDLNKQDDEFVSNENLQGAVAERELKCDNLEFSNNLSDDTHTKISETCVIDESGIDTNENSAIDSIKRTKEIYMTSAGRISIASDGDSENAKQRFSVTDNFIEETHNEEDLKEKSVETVDNQLNCENEPETVSKEPENISVDTENKTQEPVNKSEELVNQTQEPVSKSEELVNQTQEPVSKSEELVNQTQEPVSKSEELVSKTQEPVRKSEELVNETQEPVSKSEEPENKTKELVSNSEEPENKTTESVKSVKFQQEKTNEGTEKPKVAKPVKKGMDMTEEWHEDPIPGMGDADNDTDSSDSRSRHSSGDSDSSDSTRPANRPTSLQTRKKKKISANFNILKEDYASPDDIDTTDNPGDLEWENDTPVSIPKDPIPEYSAEDEYQDAKHWRGVEINGKQQKIDLKVIDPYKKVLTHGGYYGDGLNAIIVFSGCYLPDRSRKDYNYVMDNLFLYVISTLELLVAEDYMIVYFHGATPRRQMPSFGWLKKCYQMIDRRLKKNLKGLLLIHPTLWLRTIVLMTKPFISSKFSSKLKFVRTLHDLSNIVPVEYIYIPDQVKKYDSLLQHRSPAHSSSSSAPHSPP